MFPVSAPLNPEQRQLLKIFDALGAQDQASVLSFAEYLGGRSMARAPEPGQDRTEISASEPLDIPRPEQESVILAMRRLSKTYFMLDRATILQPASSLMNAHILQGRHAEGVIDELEELFKSTYESETGSG